MDYIVFGPPKDSPPEETASLRKCDGCQTEVWFVDSADAFMREGRSNSKFLCFLCFGIYLEKKASAGETFNYSIRLPNPAKRLTLDLSYPALEREGHF